MGMDNSLVVLAALFASSLLFRFILIYAGQRWVATFAHTATICTLPIVTYVITSVISGNIALSLGMVGALSIVRFRNPVKSPFELVVYFATITMGIAASVDIYWLLFLVCSVSAIVAILVVGNDIATNRFNRPLFSASFSEGNELSTLEVTAREALSEIKSDPLMISAFESEGSYRYVFASPDRKRLIALSDELTANSGVVSNNLTL
ncbi:MAG: DUF4956 domain-containing protein [Nitratireductor sp.]|nr:DUF4956 domain-containing protein [Nitratireductor sp.]